uniref:Mucin 2, oligomeric mucus/gel-forming n=1 Tax=Podarcis muralis TaxID=64176 RepID=A0A670ICQ7_PODMU
MACFYLIMCHFSALLFHDCTQWLLCPHFSGRTSSHGHYVCSTWGNNHFKTFDGDFYQFPGVCEYNFVSDCRESYQEFSVHIQRELNEQGHPDIQYVLITIKDVAIYLTHKMVVVDGQIARTPYYHSGILIEKNDMYTKLYARVGLVLIWNREAALMIELDTKFNNGTCGLCGDYNGQQVYNEFLSNGLSYNPITFGNLQKINKPNTVCEDPDETQPIESCNRHREECEKLLTAPAFADCQSRLNLEQYIQACMQDRCACQHTEDSFCLCSTISEFSRQCSHAGGNPQNWRTSQLCPKSCPGNMIYLESGSPCMDTCSHMGISKLCEEHYMDGCFCPEGTVYDDITGKGCVATSQCYCKLRGKLFSPGKNITNDCESCTCQSGRWICQDLPCPSKCAVEGGSHITTFDGKKYTFHGDCYYVLSKSIQNDSHALLGELGPCGSTDKQTCLKTVVLLIDEKKNVVVFRSDGTVLLNEIEIHLPHVTASFTVFQPSSNYIIVQATLGLRLEIQLVPVMQLFVIVDQTAQATLQGLCGNYNGIEGDDFKTSSGLIEATGASFANTWKAQASCSDMLDNWDHPCTLSVENEKYAEHWCSLLKSTETPFARCHSVIDPTDYYKRCKYDTCNCNANEECMCAALSSYARACASKGVMLWGWRKNVCNKEESSCQASQVFRYNLTCQQTCRSLSDGHKYCLEGFTPVDGCGCPDNSYMDDSGKCVPIAQCPCYYKGVPINPGYVIMKQDERWYVNTTCSIFYFTDCSPNMTYFDCNNFDSWSSQTPVHLSCQTLGNDQFQTECVSGCVCLDGLIDDGRGNCVQEQDCPCIHNKVFYSPGETVNVDCNTCTCQRGSWKCTTNSCFGTCTIYGSGHYITFDGKFYDFDGNCEYVATQDYCGNSDLEGTFSVITENVPCGTTGVTCSKAIKVFLGSTEIKLEDKQIETIEMNTTSSVTYWIREPVGLYIIIETSNGVILIWDRKTTIFIKLAPYLKGKVCGLCGNFDGKASNDFTARDMVQENNALIFGNSWKKDTACPDVDVDPEPCEKKPHRKSWAEKECSLIKSVVFEECHSKVAPDQYYEACVHDACACDSGGDCECFCTAVAVYAQECLKAGACVYWRTPDICPIFCEYWNPTDICEWHYEPCGSDIVTCKILNEVSTNFSMPYLEGCYPRCPPDNPIYIEETNTCGTSDMCGCYINGVYYRPGQSIPTDDQCTNCISTPGYFIYILIGSFFIMIQAEQLKHTAFLPLGCCIYDGKEYEEGEIIINERNGSFCFDIKCTINGTWVVEDMRPCSTTAPPTTTLSTTPSPTTTTTTTTTQCLMLACEWSKWYDVSVPEEGPEGGDFETYDAIRIKDGSNFCPSAPQNIECRAKNAPNVDIAELGQKVDCNVTYGLICRNKDQDQSLWTLCYNYEIRVNCCQIIPCGDIITTTPTTTPSTTTTTPTTTTPSPTTTTTTPTTTSTPPTTTPSTTTTTPTTTTPTPSTTTTTTSPTTTSTPPPLPLPLFPQYGPQYGDYETYDNIRAAGTEICTKPENISCRAKKFPNYSFKELGQKVECDVSTGLICHNKDQTPGPVYPVDMCLNYEIRVYCCKDECISGPPTTTPTTTTPTTTSTTTSTPLTTTTTPTTTSTPSTTTPPTTTTTIPTPPWDTLTTTPTTTSTTTTSTTTSALTSTPTPPTTTFPQYGPQYGDYETYDNIRAANIEICARPENISCRAKKFPNYSFKELGQKVECDVSTGLICHNKDQTPGPVYPVDMCLNYEISVCCKVDCGSTPSTTTTPTTTTTTSTTTTTTPTTTSPTTTISTTTGSECIICVICDWSSWIDTDSPNGDKDGGDNETYEKIREHGIDICSQPSNISCRAKDFPGTSLEELGQKLVCDASVGLICKNTDQVPGVGVAPTCLDYEISVYCCRDCSTTTVSTTTTTPYTGSTSKTTTVTTTETGTTTTVPCTTDETEPWSTSGHTTTTTPTPPTTTTSTETPTVTTTTTTTTPTPSTTTTPTPPTTTTTEPTTTTTTTTTTPTPSTTTTTPTPPTTTTTPTPSTTTTTPTPPTTTTSTETPTVTTTTTTTTPTPSTTTTPTPPTTTTTEPTTTTTTTTTTPTPSTTTTTPTPPTTTTSTETPTVTTTTTTTTPTPSTTTTLTPPTTTTTPTPSTTTTTPTPPTTTTTEPTTTTTTTTTTPTPSTTTTTPTPPTTTTSTETPTVTTTTTTTTPTPSTTTTLTPPTTTTTPTPKSMWICDCVQAFCISNEEWILKPIKCEPPPEPTCSNGLAPVRVMDENNCCWHWECDCYCTGWGDPHYKTFDGLYYSYQGNCTYTLVEEIVKTIDNFGVYIDNYHCDPREPVSCPRTLIIKHETQDIRIHTLSSVPIKIEVLVNGNVVNLPYTKYGVKIHQLGMNYMVVIPESKINITFNGISFTIRMPYELFGNNTQGQCGTCTNNTADDCRLRNGELAENCVQMADDWFITDDSKPHCPRLPPIQEPTTRPHCEPSPLCKLLLEGEFKKCHDAVDYENFYAACVFDNCRIPDRGMECASLQIYAFTCADQGVCIDWRGLTNGTCSVSCPSNRIYKACGPAQEETCKSGLIGVNQTQQIEGCFCPEGTTLYDAGVDVCVKTCGCVGPDNIPRKFGEEFEFDCKKCSCLEGGSGITCEPLKCPSDDDVSCEGDGFYTITEVNPDNKCCSKTTCVCNATDCTTEPPKCQPGYELVSEVPEGHCCPDHRCVPKNVCVANGNEYTPGSQILGDKCQKCVCTKEKDNSTSLNLISCSYIPCPTTCEQGHTLIHQDGECCGVCVQTSCVIRTPENDVFILRPGEQRSAPHDNCTIYSCVNMHRQLVSSTSSISCPAFNEETCQPFFKTFYPAGKPKDHPVPVPPCSLSEMKDYIVHDGCRSADMVPVAQCEGHCGTSSIYSSEANSMKHKCTCCRESKVSEKEITLVCPDGKNKKHKYLQVDSCECLNTECNSSHSSNESQKSTEENSREDSQEDELNAVARVRRAISSVKRRMGI